MTKNHFGVKNSQLEELMQFQLSLRNRRSKMPYAENLKVRLFLKGPVHTLRVKVATRKITLEDRTDGEMKFRLPRQRVRLSEEIGTQGVHGFELLYVATFTLSGLVPDASFFFNTFEQRAAFLQKLGNTNLSDSSEEEEEEEIPNVLLFDFSEDEEDE